MVLNSHEIDYENDLAYSLEVSLMQNELVLYDEVSGFINDPETLNFLSVDTVLQKYKRKSEFLPETDY